MPAPGAVEHLAGLSGPAFEERFLELMIPHHRGAVLMADEAWRRAGDPRLQLFSDQLRHAQRGQLDRLGGLRGVALPTADCHPCRRLTDLPGGSATAER